jgi:hypothetical protein
MPQQPEPDDGILADVGRALDDANQAFECVDFHDLDQAQLILYALALSTYAAARELDAIRRVLLRQRR